MSGERQFRAMSQKHWVDHGFYAFVKRLLAVRGPVREDLESVGDRP
jgi:hypothetical protein